MQKSASAAHKHQSCYSGLQVTGHRYFPIQHGQIKCVFGLKQNHCGADRDRTDGLSIANAALSQLSYGPNNHLDKIIDSINTFQYKATYFELEVMLNNFEMNIKNMEIFFINSA